MLLFWRGTTQQGSIAGVLVGTLSSVVTASVLGRMLVVIRFSHPLVASCGGGNSVDSARDLIPEHAVGGWGAPPSETLIARRVSAFDPVSSSSRFGVSQEVKLALQPRLAPRPHNHDSFWKRRRCFHRSIKREVQGLGLAHERIHAMICSIKNRLAIAPTTAPRRPLKSSEARVTSKSRDIQSSISYDPPTPEWAMGTSASPNVHA